MQDYPDHPVTNRLDVLYPLLTVWHFFCHCFCGLMCWMKYFNCELSKSIHISEEYQTYCAGQSIVSNVIPRCNKDPRSVEVQIWEMCLYILIGSCEYTSISILLIWNNTSQAVVKVSPETSNYILASFSRKWVGNIFVWSLVECKVSIIIHLKNWNIIKSLFTDEFIKHSPLTYR